jgi:hypothetical protein
MTKRLEVELDDPIKDAIDSYAKKKGLRKPFAYGELLRIGLLAKQKEDDTKECQTANTAEPN